MVTNNANTITHRSIQGHFLRLYNKHLFVLVCPSTTSLSLTNFSTLFALYWELATLDIRSKGILPLLGNEYLRWVDSGGLWL